MKQIRVWEDQKASHTPGPSAFSHNLTASHAAHALLFPLQIQVREDQEAIIACLVHLRFLSSKLPPMLRMPCWFYRRSVCGRTRRPSSPGCHPMIMKPCWTCGPSCRQAFGGAVACCFCCTCCPANLHGLPLVPRRRPACKCDLRAGVLCWIIHACRMAGVWLHQSGCHLCCAPVLSQHAALTVCSE